MLLQKQSLHSSQASRRCRSLGGVRQDARGRHSSLRQIRERRLLVPSGTRDILLFSQGSRRHEGCRSLAERPATAGNGSSSLKCRKTFFVTLILGRCEMLVQDKNCDNFYMLYFTLALAHHDFFLNLL